MVNVELSEDLINILFKFIPDSIKFLDQSFYRQIIKRTIRFDARHIVGTTEEAVWSTAFNNTCYELLSLQELHIYNSCRDMNDHLYKLNNLKHLKKITIWGYHDLTDHGLDQIPDTIEELTLIFCFNITNRPLSRFKKLKRLVVKYCPLVWEDISLSPTLEHITFITNDYISDEFFKSISNNQNLKSITLNYCFSITAISLAILKLFTNLKKIHLTDILNITLEETKEVLDVLVNVEYIYMSSIFWKVYKDAVEKKYRIVFNIQELLQQAAE